MWDLLKFCYLVLTDKLKLNSTQYLQYGGVYAIVCAIVQSLVQSLSLFQVLVWHTRTEKPHMGNEPKFRKDTVVIEV